MKKLFSFLFFLFLTGNIFAQSTNGWIWTRYALGTSNSEGWAVCTDAGDNVFITGFYQNSSITFGSFTLPSPGTVRSMYIVKYDSQGNVVWAKSSVGGDVWGYAVTVDAGGNSFVTGDFTGSSTSFGSFTVNNSSTSSSLSDMYIVKYDPQGNEVWAKSAAGTGNDVGNGISADAAGNVFVTGNFRGVTMTFGSTTLTNADQTPWSDDVFIAKYDPAGNVLWAKCGNGITFDNGSSVNTDGSGNVFATGYFYSDTIIFDSDTLINVTNNGSRADIYIVKYDPSGNVLWTKSAGGVNNDFGYSVSADPAGNVFVSGALSGSAMISKYNAAGTLFWTRTSSGSGNMFSYCVSADNAGNAFLTGGYTGATITFGSTILTAPSGNCAPFLCDPMFIVKYDPAGNVICASTLVNGSDDISGVAADNSGNAYFCSDFFANPFIVGNDTIVPPAVETAYISKFNCSANEVDNKTNSESIAIFPNPSNGKFVFSMSEFQSNGNLKIYNVLGELIYQSEITGQKTEIDLSGNAKGIYFYQISSSGKNNLNGKIIIR